MLICLDGLLKPNGLGSLHEPATTSLFPNNWRTVPLSFGLIMCKSFAMVIKGEDELTLSNP